MLVVFDTCLLYIVVCHHMGIFFFFNDTATTEIYTLSLHDALPIWKGLVFNFPPKKAITVAGMQWTGALISGIDRKSTRLNSSHSQISYAVFCLKKKKFPAGTVHAAARRPTPTPTHASHTSGRSDPH